MKLKKLILLCLAFVTLTCFSQQKHAVQKQTSTVSFITKMDIANATKDGFYLNGYVVNIDYARAKKLNGRTIRVTGKVTIVKGLNHTPKEYTKNGEEILVQGRMEDTRHILHPAIEVINK